MSFIVILLMIIGIGSEESVMAQLTSSSASFAFTGSATPSRGGFTGVLPGDGLRVGPFFVHPFLGFAEIYSDNVFRTNTNRQSDFVHVIAPGIQLQLPVAGRHRVVLDYRAAQQINQRFSVNDALTQGITGQTRVNFPGGLNLKMQGGHTQGFDPRGSTFDVQAAELTTWHVNSFIGEAEILGSWAGARIRGTARDRNYENNNQAPRRDRISSGLDLTLYGSMTAKTYASLTIGASRNVYDQNTQLDSFSWRASGGLRWTATGKTRGELNVGYEVLNFDHAPMIQQAGSVLSFGGNTQQNIRIDGRVVWEPTSRTTITATPFRRISQSGVLNTSIVTQTGVNLSASHSIGNRTTLSENLSFSDNQFSNDQANQSTANRRDQRINAGLGVGYQAVKWLGVRFQYQYQQRNSTIDRFENYANTLMVSIQGMF